MAATITTVTRADFKKLQSAAHKASWRESHIKPKLTQEEYKECAQAIRNYLDVIPNYLMVIGADSEEGKTIAQNVHSYKNRVLYFEQKAAGRTDSPVVISIWNEGKENESAVMDVSRSIQAEIVAIFKDQWIKPIMDSDVTQQWIILMGAHVLCGDESTADLVSYYSADTPLIIVGQYEMKVAAERVVTELDKRYQHHSFWVFEFSEFEYPKLYDIWYKNAAPRKELNISVADDDDDDEAITEEAEAADERIAASERLCRE